MAPPPAKRLRRLVVLSSEDDEDSPLPAEKAREGKPTKDAEAKTTSKQTNGNGTMKPSLPSNSRTKPTGSSSKLKPSTVTLSSPDPSPKKPTGKSKLTAKPAAEKQPSKLISSFFGGANQSQLLNSQTQAKKETPRVETPEIEDEEEDLIEDDSPIDDMDEPRGLQDTTKFVLDRRKAAFASTQSVPASRQTQKLPAASQRFKIAGSATSKSKDTPNAVGPAPKVTDSKPWAERFGPSNLEELAVHKKKVADVRSWLENALQGRDRKRLLILRGPSGAGKTATISTLAKAMDLELSEWRNPVGSEYSSEGYLSMSAQFEEFLGRSSKFGALPLRGNIGNEHTVSSPATTTNGGFTRRKTILLEEFPNTFLSTSSALRSFRSSILEYLAMNTPSMGTLFSRPGLAENATPVVMIITETRLTTTTAASDSFTTHRLLGAQILSHPGVSIIDFNPVASTYLTKALDLVVQKEARQSGRRRIPGPSALKRLGEVGDVRSAIGSLEFLCLRGEDGDDWGGRVASRAKKGANASSVLTKMEKESLEMVTRRESSLGLFHAVGKVVYNKRDDFKPQAQGPDTDALPQPPDHMPDHIRPRISQVSVDQLIDETGTDTSTFVAALHENYVLSCEGSHFPDTLNGCLDALSSSDLLSSPRGGRFGSSSDFGGRSFQGASSDFLRQDDICFQLAVRGLLFALPDPVMRHAHPVAGKSGGKNDTYKMFYPTSVRLSRQTEEIEGLIEGWRERLRARVKNLGHAGRQFAATLRSKGPKPDPTRLAEQDTPDESARTSLNCTKSELLLERLPYITKIEQRNPTSSHLSDLEKITQFHGIGAPNEEISDEENIDERAPATEWTTDRPADGKPGSLISNTGIKGALEQGGKDANMPVLPVEDEVGKLYLSDDDIEDD